MLEFLIVYFVAKKNGAIVEAKGHRGTRYKWLTAGLWFGGEIAGFIVGLAIGGRDADIATVYVFAILGALIGVAIAWWLASNVTPAPMPVWNFTHSVPPQGISAWAQPNPALAPIMTIPGGVQLIVLGQAGDWAQVAAANGFSGFVDARLLVPRFAQWQQG